jgi:hypothetical protein
MTALAKIGDDEMVAAGESTLTALRDVSAAWRDVTQPIRCAARGVSAHRQL